MKLLTWFIISLIAYAKMVFNKPKFHLYICICIRVRSVNVINNISQIRVHYSTLIPPELIRKPMVGFLMILGGIKVN